MILPEELLVIRLGRAQKIISTRAAPICLHDCQWLDFSYNGAQINVIILEMIQTVQLHCAKGLCRIDSGRKKWKMIHLEPCQKLMEPIYSSAFKHEQTFNSSSWNRFSLIPLAGLRWAGSWNSYTESSSCTARAFSSKEKGRNENEILADVEMTDSQGFVRVKMSNMSVKEERQCIRQSVSVEKRSRKL